MTCAHVFDAPGIGANCLSCGVSRTKGRAPLGITDFRPPAQRRRAVKRWWGNARPWTLDIAMHRRNLLIASYARRGLSTRAIGRRVKLSHVHVARLLAALGFAWTRAQGWFRVLQAIVHHPSPPTPAAGKSSTLERLQRRWGIRFRGIKGFLRARDGIPVDWRRKRPRGRPQPTGG